MKTVIKNATLYTMDTLNNQVGYVACSDGVIETVGTDFDPEAYADYDIIDAKKQLLTPGLVDPHSHIGVMEEGIQFEGNDGNETTNPVYPELRAIDSLYPLDSSFKSALAAGVTTAVTGPGSANVIGGTFTAVKTVGDTIDDMVFKDEVCMKMALGENPKRVYSSQKRNPSTRMASAALMREWLQKAKEYDTQLKKYEAGEADASKPSFDMKLHSLRRVFNGLPVKIHAHRSDDIMTAIRVAKEFDLNITIEHATEAHTIPKSVKAGNFPVILGPTLGTAAKYELRGKSFESAKIVHAHDIPFAIMTDHPVIPAENILVQLALFVKEGLSRLEAMKAVTINAARINGIDARVGSIAPGKDADLVLWDGDFFDIMTRPKRVFVNGKSQYKQG